MALPQPSPPSPPANRGSGRARVAGAIAVIVLAAAIAYAPSFRVPFQFDDEARLSHNLAMQKGEFLEALWWLGNSRVVASATLILNYRLGGFEPFGYHVGNFAVHLLTAVGVFALALALCRAPRLRAFYPPQRAVLLAAAAGLLFAVHPLQTQAVTYIIQRYASMAALFYVWAVVFYLLGRLRSHRIEAGRAAPWFIASGVLAICGVLSKENAVSLPAALLLSEWVGFGPPRRWRAIAVGAVVALTILAVPMLLKTMLWRPSGKVEALTELSFAQRLVKGISDTRYSPLGGARPGPVAYLLTEATVLPRYLRLVVLPWGLNVDHDVTTADGLSAPVLAWSAFLAVLAGLGVAQMRRRPLLAFGILWFFITLSVESSVVPIDDPMMEHRMYLPMAGLAVGLAWLFTAAEARARRTALAVGLVVAVALIALTFARNLVWLTPRSLWLDAAEKSPNKARPHVNLGAAYHKADQLADAVDQYCLGLKLDPRDTVAHDNLELALTTLGKYDDVVPEVVERRPNGSVVLALPDAVTFCP